MLGAKYVPLVIRQVTRRRTRTLLTAGGVAVAMFLFCAVRSMREGVEAATKLTAADTKLVVYRAGRFCPSTSRLPQRYEGQIRAIPGVASVVPIKVAVTHCGTSLDVVTFRGVPAEAFARDRAGGLRVLAGSIEDWLGRSDAALVGEVLAARRRLSPGDRFSAAGVTTTVAAVVASDQEQDRNAAYVHLDFLQRAAAGGGRNGAGIVTQFDVTVTDAARLTEAARAIDATFASDAEPTRTTPEKAFVARAASDVVEIVSFARWLGYGCLAAVLALVANSIVLSVRDRVREHAVLRTLGYTGPLIAALVVAEGLLLALLGGALGTALAAGALAYGKFTLSAEGFSIHLPVTAGLIGTALVIAAGLGLLAGVVPAIQASRRDIVSCFRAV